MLACELDTHSTSRWEAAVCVLGEIDRPSRPWPRHCLPCQGTAETTKRSSLGRVIGPGGTQSEVKRTAPTKTNIPLLYAETFWSSFALCLYRVALDFLSKELFQATEFLWRPMKSDKSPESASGSILNTRLSSQLTTNTDTKIRERDVQPQYFFCFDWQCRSSSNSTNLWQMLSVFKMASWSGLFLVSLLRSVLQQLSSGSS